MIRKEVLKVRSYAREELFENEPRENKRQNLQNLFTPNNVHKLVFDQIPKVGFKTKKLERPSSSICMANAR